MGNITFNQDVKNDIVLDDLVIGDALTEKNYALTDGQDIVRGEALALSGGKLVTYVEADKASKPFYGLATVDMAADGADVDNYPVYTKGEFNANKVVFSASADAATGISLLQTSGRLLGMRFLPALARTN